MKIIAKSQDPSRCGLGIGVGIDTGTTFVAILFFRWGFVLGVEYFL